MDRVTRFSFVLDLNHALLLIFHLRSSIHWTIFHFFWLIGLYQVKWFISETPVKEHERTSMKEHLV